MKRLSEYWLTEGLADAEYKRYMLLGWLQEVHKEFNESKLYPSISDLVAHYRNLMQYRESKQLLRQSFPKELNSANLETLSLIYNDLVEDDEATRLLDEIVEFSLPQMKQHLDKGQELHQWIEQRMSINPIGLMPLHKGEGIVMLHTFKRPEVLVYTYKTTLFESRHETYRGIHCQYLTTATHSLGSTFEQIKVDVIKSLPALTNPAAYLVESALMLPHEETLLPIAKRMLVRYVVTT